MTQNKGYLKKIVFLGICASVALVMYILESMIPNLIPIPGIKLGLANIVTLFLLIEYKPYDAFIVLIIRVILAGCIAGQLISFLFSLCGGIGCWLIMTLMCKLTQKKYVIIISIFGAIVHNLIQLIIARFVIGSADIWIYLPYLMISAIVTGFVTGLVCKLICLKLDKAYFKKSN